MPKKRVLRVEDFTDEDWRNIAALLEFFTGKPRSKREVERAFVRRV
jgi:hypothetical protein